MVDRTQSTRAKQNKTSSSRSTATRSAKSRTSQGETDNVDSKKQVDTKIQEAEVPSRRSSRRLSAAASVADPNLAESRQPTRVAASSSRQSCASDNSSLLSLRGHSPLSAPATPATSYSTVTNVSTSSSAQSSKEKRVARASAPASSTTKDLSNSTSTSTNQGSKGKIRESTVPPATKGKGKKRVRSPSPIEEPSVKTESDQHRRTKISKAEEEVSVAPYSLRSRSRSSLNTTPATASVKMADTTAKGKGSRSKAAKASRMAEVAPPPPAASSSAACAIEDSPMDVDLISENRSEMEGGETETEVDGIVEEGEEHIEGMEEDEDEDEDEEDPEGRQHDQDENEEDDGHYDDDEMGDPYGDGGEEGGGGSGAFSSHLRAMAGYMSGLSGKFRTLLAAIRDRKDPASQLVALQELSEVLSISNEDTLSGYFPAESFITELIYLMGGPKPPSRHTNTTGESSKAKADQDEEQEREEETAAAIAAAAGLEDNGERMLLACRCLANLIEAMPYAAHSIVSLGAVPVLNSKLMEIEFIDLAEQVLQTLEKISNEYPSAIVREDGLQAMLQYLDFFNIHIQRTAMSAAANCCRRMSVESFPKVKSILSIIKNVLSYSDQRLVESACRCIVRLVDSYRHQGEILEQILTDEMVASINSILLPASSGANVNASSSTASTTTVNTVTYTDILKALGVAARVSPKTAVTLLENNVVETLYHLLTGSPAPDEDGSGGRGPAATSNATLLQKEEDSAGAAIAIVTDSGVIETVSSSTDVAVLQNLAHRPKEQVQEALSLVAELLPPLPRHGVFDSRMYTEKAYQRRKAKMAKAAKQARDAERLGQRSVLMEKVASADSSVDPVNDEPEAVTITSVALAKPAKVKSERELAKEQAQAKRVNTLQDRQSLVKRFTQLILPTLVEVYAASVALHVRSKALFGILKIISFVEAKPLLESLDNVPLASFIAAILSSRDHPTLIQAALQLVEMLTTKLPDVYSALLRREGVMWEIEDIAAKESTAKAVKAKATTTAELQPGTGASTATDGATSASTATTTTTSATASSVMPSLNITSMTDLTSTDLSRLLAGAGVPGGLSRLANRIPSSSVAVVGSASASTTILSVSGQPTTTVEAEDSNIWRARILRDQFSPDASKASSGGAVEAGRALDEIKKLVVKLQTTATKSVKVAEDTLQKTAELFSKPDNPISSFELLKSGMVDGLYTFAVGDSSQVPRQVRRTLMSQILNQQQQQHPVNVGVVSAASALVRRLQETLSRLETFDITTAINNPTDEARRSPTANVARQIRLKLVAENEEGDIPRNCSNLIVSIHAITSFQSLNDYLRPKIAASQAMSAGGGSGSGPISSSDGALTSQLSGALAAFASSGGFDMYPSLRTSLTSGGNNGASGSSSTALGAALAAQRKRLTSESKQGGETIATSSASIGEPSTKEKTSGPPKKDEETSRRRRSSRLSGKGVDEAKIEKTEEKKSGAVVGEGNDTMEEALARRLVEGLLQDGMEGLEDEGFTDDEDFEEEVIEDAAGLEADESAADRTINLDVAQDGTKIEAKTPDGTRIATPTNDLSRSAPAASASTSTPIPTTSSSGKGSYASALQKRPTDWHLEFQMEGVEIPLDSTIYGAIHRYEMQRQQTSTGSQSTSGVTPRYIWSNTYTVKYRKVAGPALTNKEKEATSAQKDNIKTSLQSETDLPASIPQEAAYARILQLLRVLYDLNLEYRGSLSVLGNTATATNKGLIEATFVNNKLTAKLNRQLEEPMIVASNCLPAWSLDLPRSFPFLFPFEVRYAFLQSTSFGYHRLINKWQNQQSRNQEGSNSLGNNSRHDDSLSLLGRLTRQKVRISRNNILASAFKVFELYGTNSSLLEVEYFDEVGTGLGPTLEFYALVSKEFAKKGLNLWRGDDKSTSEGDYIFSSNGLFPSPCTEKLLASTKGKSILQSFIILGQFVAKALFDSRIVDLHFSSIMMQAVVHQNVPETMAMLQMVDPALALSLKKLQEMDASEIDSLALDFTLPGQTDYLLRAGGSEVTVTKDNVEEYVAEVIHHTLNQGVAPLLQAFRQGFDKIFPITAMTIFTADQIVMLFGNNDEDWSEATLMSSIKPDHGYNADSPTFRDIISLMSEFSLVERRDFLQWLTGSPKLPIGGFAGLHPPLTIVKRPPEANANPDKTLPSVMTCVNFCKLPPFSSKTVMRERLLLAIREGHASFHLS